MKLRRKKFTDPLIVECANRIDQLFRQRHTMRDIEYELNEFRAAIERRYCQTFDLCSAALKRKESQ